jgi:hypothetical protein
MSRAARVHSVEALDRVHQALSQFAQEVREALVAATSDIQRTFAWLEQESKWWKGEILRRQDQLGQARNALNRKKLERVFGRKPDLTEEERAYRRARLRLEQAEAMVVQIRQAVVALERAVLLYQGPAQQLSGYLDTGVPRSLAWLERKEEALAAYLALRPPSSKAAPSEAEASQQPQTASPHQADGPPQAVEAFPGQTGTQP